MELPSSSHFVSIFSLKRNLESVEILKHKILFFFLVLDVERLAFQGKFYDDHPPDNFHCCSFRISFYCKVSSVLLSGHRLLGTIMHVTDSWPVQFQLICRL